MIALQGHAVEIGLFRGLQRAPIDRCPCGRFESRVHTHMLMHVQDCKQFVTKETFTCTTCGRVCASKTGLSSHMNSCRAKAAGLGARFECKSCLKPYTREADYRVHEAMCTSPPKAKKTPEGRVVCEYCNGEYTPRGISNHKRACKNKGTAQEVARIPCEFCNKYYKPAGMITHQYSCSEYKRAHGLESNERRQSSSVTSRRPTPNVLDQFHLSPDGPLSVGGFPQGYSHTSPIGARGLESAANLAGAQMRSMLFPQSEAAGGIPGFPHGIPGASPGSKSASSGSSPGSRPKTPENDAQIQAMQQKIDIITNLQKECEDKIPTLDGDSDEEDDIDCP